MTDMNSQSCKVTHGTALESTVQYH